MPTMKFTKTGSGGSASLSRSTQVVDSYGAELSADLPAAQPAVLTTRTNATDGTLTMNNANHGIVTGAKFSLFWSGGLIANLLAGTVAGTSVPFTLESIGTPTSLGALGKDTIIGGKGDDDDEEDKSGLFSRSKGQRKFVESPKRETAPDVTSEEESEEIAVTPFGAVVSVNSPLPVVNTPVMAGLRVSYAAGWSFPGNDMKSMFCGASVPWSVLFFFAAGGGPTDVAAYGSYDPAGGVKMVDTVNNIANDGSGLVDTNPFAGETLVSVQVSHGSPAAATVSAAALVHNS